MQIMDKSKHQNIYTIAPKKAGEKLLMTATRMQIKTTNGYIDVFLDLILR